MPILRSPQLHLRIQFRKEADKNPGALTIDRADRPVTSVFFFCFMIQKQGGTASIAVAVGGLVLGEMVSALYTLHTFFRPFSRPEKKNATRSHLSLSGLFCGLKELLPLSLPLTANRYCSIFSKVLKRSRSPESSGNIISALPKL